MSAVMKSTERGGGSGLHSSRSIFKVWPVALGLAGLAMLLAFYRLYQGAYSFKYGLDSTTPEFAKYWVTMFEIEIPLIFGLGLLSVAYLWFTRDKNLAKIDPDTELRRYFVLIGWFMLYTFSFLGIASFYGESDGTWHQTVIRDTALTPSHIVVFYACVPLYMCFGFSTLMYAMTRIPKFSKGYSVPLLFVVFGPALILANLGYNEWGHAFWFTEEIFSHPLHWGFTVLGWTGLGLGGVLLQVVMRMSELFKEITAADKLGAIA